MARTTLCEAGAALLAGSEGHLAKANPVTQQTARHASLQPTIRFRPQTIRAAHSLKRRSCRRGQSCDTSPVVAAKMPVCEAQLCKAQACGDEGRGRIPTRWVGGNAKMAATSSADVIVTKAKGFRRPVGLLRSARQGLSTPRDLRQKRACACALDTVGPSQTLFVSAHE